MKLMNKKAIESSNIKAKEIEIREGENIYKCQIEIPN